ncbi:hypothetical protein NP493_479g01042 [Ridgeia piscesae]|uniref:Cytochrome b561 domain-containing protein n=1 Tax=Ridgeia piscesae TaxID=27915 RepID=A0AAD9KYC2_RIDPI|nr:hypothetical protein NP493_479g01042 [Ridgeia piscesae]
MKISVAFAWFIAIFHPSLEIDLSRCGTSVGCLRSPDGCKDDACDVAALWSKGATGNTIDFEITAKGNSYVAIGFSKDTDMPEDAGLTLTSSSSTGGFVTCKFTHGTKKQHASNARMRSKSLVDLLSTTESGGSSEGTARKSVLHKVHGSSVSWCWPSYVWSLFQVHRSLMVLALLLTVSAFIIIFVQVKEYTQFSGDSYFKQSHPPMGIVITALVIINPIMTFFRCHPGAKYRAVFDWAHFSVGMSALILSFINVFSGVTLGGFKDSVMWVMAAYIIFYVIIMLVMEAHKCSKCSGSGKSKSMELRSKSSRGSDPPSPPSLIFKYSMLIIFMSASVGLFAVMLILVVV